MHDSVRSSASVGLIIGSALIFNYIVASENIPAQVQQMMKGRRPMACCCLCSMPLPVFL